MPLLTGNYIEPRTPNKVTQTHSGTEIPELTLEPGKNGKVNIMLLSDIHFGSISFRRELFEKHLELAKKLKAYIVLVGDIMEVALPSHIEQSVWEQDLTTGEQYKTAREYFKPFKDRILFSLSGNHDFRVYKKTGLDVAELLADELGCFYNKAGGYLIVNVGDQRYTFSAWHGASGSANPWTEMERRFRVYDQADITAMGNNHQLCYKAEVKKRIINGKEQRHLVYFVRTGSFISEPDYSRMALYSPTVDGAPVVTLDSAYRNIEVDVRGETRWNYDG